MIEGAVTEDSAFYLSYRESLLQFYVENFVDEDEIVFTEVPKNSDYQMKYHWAVDSVSNLRLFATGANDSVGIEFGPESDDLQHEPDLAGGLDAAMYFHTQAITYDTIVAGGTSTKLAFSRKEASQNFEVGTLVDIEAINYQYRFKNYYQTPLNNGDTLRYGIDSSSTEIDYTVFGKDTPCNDEFEICQPASLGDPFTAGDSLTINSTYIFSAYDWLATPFWELSLGLGSSYNDFTEETTLQPRLNTRYELNDQWTLTGAVGRHAQFHRDFRFVDENVGTPDLKMPYSDHIVTGFEFTLDDSISAKVEAYYKDLQDLVLANPERLTDDTADKYVSGVSGKAYGLELLINKNLTNKWYGWFSLAYSQTKRTNEITGEDFNYNLDRPWVLNLVASYKKSDTVTYGWKWRYESGALFTPVSDAEPVDSDGVVVDLDGNGDPVNPDDVYLWKPTYGVDALNSERLPASHNLDFRVDYEPKPDRTFYFEIRNVYGQRNISEYKYNEDYTEREEVESLPTIFNFGVKLIY